MSSSAGVSGPVSVWNPRYKRNVYLYFIIYALLGVVTGVTNNTMENYLDLIAPNLITGMMIYSAISSIFMAWLLAEIHRFGYKQMLVWSSVISAASLLVFIFTRVFWIVAIAYVVNSTFVAMFDVVYPLMFAVETPRAKRTKFFQYIMIDNLFFQAIMTFFGGKIAVKVYSGLMHISYAAAGALSSNEESLRGLQLEKWLESYQAVIWIAVVFAAAAFFFALLMKDEKQDYQETDEERAARHEQKEKFSWKKKETWKRLFTRDVIMWFIYVNINGFGASLCLPYFPIFLSHFLHIERGAVSTIIALQTVAMFLGYFLADRLEKKFGSVGSLVLAVGCCIPLMLLMPNLGSIAHAIGISLTITTGVILFFRSGIANMASPVSGSLSMSLVPKDYRPAFSSAGTVIGLCVSFLEGLFTQYVLFTTNQGYATAYYIAAGCYVVSIVFLMLTLFKKYNRISRREAAAAAAEAAEEAKGSQEQAGASA